MASTRVRKRALAVLAAFLGFVGVAAVVIPAQAAPPGAVQLHLGTDGQYFAYGGLPRQNLTASGCSINSAEPIIDLSGLSNKPPGLVSNSIGVRGSSNATGTPCGQVDSNEGLRLARGSSLTSRFTGVRLDLEMTGDALVKLTLASSTRSVVYQLQTGRSITTAQSGESGYDRTVPYTVSSSPGDELDACAAANSSGPNSGPNDNCQWTVQPGFDFDTITLTTSGTVALEGSGDFGNDPDFDTLLYLANSAPTATNDTYATNEDTSLQGNVLSNDSDADGNPLSASVVASPAHGVLTLAATGAFTYVPAPNWFGTDSFRYAASDGASSTTATATITVRSVNDSPVAATAGGATSEDTLVVVTVATDVDSVALTSTCTSSDGGTIADNGDGTVDFTPPANFTGTLTLTCTAVDDQGGSTTLSFPIVVNVGAVNDPPVAYGETTEVAADSSVVIDVLVNDTDVDGDDLGVTSIGALSPSGATAIVNPDGTVTYTPPAGYEGPGSFTYRANDGQASSNLATVDVTVFPVICSTESVSDTDGDVGATFTRLTDQFQCKRYDLDAEASGNTVLFTPSGGDFVSYRGVLTFGSEAAPASGEYPLFLRYDPTGGEDYQAVLWCIAPQFDGDGDVTSATLPDGESWCIASADTRGDSGGGLTTTWQVYGFDDPKFTRWHG